MRYREKLLKRMARVDLPVGGRVLVELKAVKRLSRVHVARTITYLKLGGFRLAFLLNFHVERSKQGIRRLVA